MANTPSGLHLKESGDDFVLIVAGENDTTTEVTLTAEQVLTLGQSALAFRSRILIRHNPTIDGVEAVLVTNVEDIWLNPNSLKTSVLLTLLCQSTRLTFALAPNLATRLAQSLPTEIAKIVGINPTRQ